MSGYFVQIVYDDIDLTDEGTLSALENADLVAAEPLDDVVRVTGSVDAQNPVIAAKRLLDTVRAVLPAARPLMAARDLVNITDIADRVGVTREAVRNWSSGKRRAGNFPKPLDSPGGQKVWEWSSVHAWLRHNLHIWDGLNLPTHAEYASIDRLIALASVEDVAHVEPVQGTNDWYVVSAVRPDVTPVPARTHEPDLEGIEGWRPSAGLGTEKQLVGS